MKIREADLMVQTLNTMLQVKGIVGFKIARNLRMLNDELKEYYKIKQELFEKYGTQQGDELVIDKTTENFTNYLKEIEPYEEQEVNFDFKKITEEELQNSDLTVEQILILSDYFEE